MGDGKRYSIVLTYYRDLKPDGTLMESTRVALAVDSIPEAKKEAEELLGEERDGRSCHISSVVEFAAHLRQ